MKFKVDIKSRNQKAWTGTGTRFKTYEEAERYAQELMSRWRHVEHWRIATVPDDQTMTVGELRRALSGVPEDRPVFVCMTAFLNLTQHDIVSVIADSIAVCLFPREE